MSSFKWDWGGLGERTTGKAVTKEGVSSFHLDELFYKVEVFVGLQFGNKRN